MVSGRVPANPIIVCRITLDWQCQQQYTIHFFIPVIPAVYMTIIVPIGFLIGVDDIRGHTHYLYYYNDSLYAYVCVHMNYFKD